MAYIIERFGSLILPEFNTLFSLDTISSKNTMVRTVSGKFDTAGAAQAGLALPQTLRYRGVIHENTMAAWRDSVDALRAVSRTRAKLWRTACDNGEQQSCVARFMSGAAERDFRAPLTVYETTIQFLQLSPWVGHDHRFWALDDGHYLDNDLYLNDAGYTVTLSTSPQSVVVTNGGNRAVSDIRLTFTAGSTPITSMTVACGNAQIIYSGTIAAGGTLVIDSGAQSVIKSGVADYAHFTLTSNHTIEEWLRFDPGDNTLTATKIGGGTTSTLLIEFQDGWE